MVSGVHVVLFVDLSIFMSLSDAVPVFPGKVQVKTMSSGAVALFGIELERLVGGSGGTPAKALAVLLVALVPKELMA